MNHDLKYFWNDTVFVVYVSVLVQWDFNLYTFLPFYYRLVSLSVHCISGICLRTTSPSGYHLSYSRFVVARSLSPCHLFSLLIFL